jgi:toxin ParE1/3/4
MKMLAVRPQALLEIEVAASYYEGEQAGLGGRFSDTVEAAFMKIQATPGIGSSRYGDLVPGLQMYVLPTFPFLIFYLEHADRLEVVRILHAKRDLPQELQA